MSARTRERRLAKPQGASALVTLSRTFPYADGGPGRWRACVAMRPGSVLTLIHAYALGVCRPSSVTGSLARRLGHRHLLASLEEG